jgi:uncharacterized membrane protein
MLLATTVVIGLTAIAAVTIFGYGNRHSAPQLARPVHGRTPADEAERILARRYVRGEITTEEFDRMMVILRR